MHAKSPKIVLKRTRNQSKAEVLPTTTPFLRKCMPKLTSTPCNVANKLEELSSKGVSSTKNDPQYNEFANAIESLSPQGPILGDIGNTLKGTRNIRNSANSLDENENKENISSSSNKSKESEELVKPKRNSRRRSVGARRVSIVATDNANQNCTSTCSKLRVRLARCSLDNSNSTPGNKSSDLVQTKSARKRKQILSPPETAAPDKTLVKRLRADWSSTTLEETPLQSRPKSNPTKLLPPGKRRLTPVFEISIDGSHISNQQTPQPKAVSIPQPDEGGYSSSAEFESEDEKEKSRSKRAPTWRDLSKKTSESLPAKSVQIVRPQHTRRSKNLQSGAKETQSCHIRLKRSGRILEKTQHLAKAKVTPSKATGSVSLSTSSYSPRIRIRRTPMNKVSSSRDSTQVEPLETSHSKEADDHLNNNELVGVCQKSAGCQGDPEPNFVIEDANVSPKPREEQLQIPSQSTQSLKTGFVRRPKELPALGGENQNCRIEESSEILEKSVSPPISNRILTNKPELIEQILSSSVEPDEENVAPEHVHTINCTASTSNRTGKFFPSRIGNLSAVPETPELPKRVSRRSSKRRKKLDATYDFLSQSSTDAEDPAADIIKKMIDTGKVVVAKHKKGTGKSVIPKKRKARKKKVAAVAEEVFSKPTKPVNRKPLQEKVLHTVHFDDNDDDTHFADADFVDDEPRRDQRGFSDLARSAMIKQAGKNDDTGQRKIITDRNKLLAMAKKIVDQSTPIRVPPVTQNTSQASSIMGNASPWRVADDNLPSAFYFSRNSANLPSFSSDYIPSTPLKNKSKSTSSFSSNDSNMENMAPPGTKSIIDTTRNSLNTRRALSYRSPLKQITILEDIALPPLAMDNTGNKTAEESAIRDKTNKSSEEENNAASKTSLFGFEDMIEDDSTEASIDQSVIGNKQRLKENLERLKRLRPDKPIVTSSKTNTVKPVFDNPRPKVRTLKQMFCSTMIHNPRDSEPKARNEDVFERNCDADLSNLFKDPEPEKTHFDESQELRTYARPFKRKRKLRHNFVMFMDSDESGEEEAEKAKDRQKKKKKQQKDDAELNKFANEFNEMCKEVSQYELVVE